MSSDRLTSIHLVILADKNIRRELGVSDSDWSKIDGFADTQAAKFKSITSLAKSEKESEMEKQGEEIDKFLKGTLPHSAVTRLREIGLQIGGPLAVRGGLGASNSEVEALDDVLASTRDNLVTTLSGNLSGSMDMSKVAEAYTSRKEKASSVISSATKDQLAISSGAPFELAHQLFQS